jgi:hypothetical protein
MFRSAHLGLSLALLAAVLADLPAAVAADEEAQDRGVRILDAPSTPSPEPGATTPPPPSLAAPASPQAVPALAAPPAPSQAAAPLVRPPSGSQATVPPLVAPPAASQQAIAPSLVAPPNAALTPASPLVAPPLVAPPVGGAPPAGSQQAIAPSLMAPAAVPAGPSAAPISPMAPAVLPPEEEATLAPQAPQQALAPQGPQQALVPPSLAPPPINEYVPTNAKAENSAGLAIDVLPGTDLQVGSRVAFRVATRKSGYLIIVDVDPSGKLTQIYPNPMSLGAQAGREGANLIKPGRAVTLPDSARNPLAGFEFVASPPLGTAMVVAILSDRPVQMVDLPDVPASLAGSAEAVNYLYGAARDLRVAGPAQSGAVQEAKWSFDAKFYRIR